MTDNVTRRRFLEALGATGAATLLAGCGEDNDPEVRDDPNEYDYQFVEGKEIAVNMPKYTGDVTTQTYVEFTNDFLPMDEKEKSFRMYEAHPPETGNTFPVAEELDGPIYEALGDKIHTDEHTDVLFQLYGTTQEVDDRIDDGHGGRMSYHERVFIVDDARVVEDPTETTTPGNSTTNETNSTTYEG